MSNCLNIKIVAEYTDRMSSVEKIIDLKKSDMECEGIFIQYTANMSSAYLQSIGLLLFDVFI